MTFNDHSRYRNTHAYLSASSNAWLRYDDAKFEAVFAKRKAAERGSILHDYAHRSIMLNQKLPRNNKALNMFVNDAIGFKMESELILFYSEWCYGTTDALSFRNGMLRVHDYKSGEYKAGFDQLFIYMAMFCLEYSVNPEDILMEARIYQDGIEVDENGRVLNMVAIIPEAEWIRDIMNIIIHRDKHIRKMEGAGVL